MENVNIDEKRYATKRTQDASRKQSPTVDYHLRQHASAELPAGPSKSAPDLMQTPDSFPAKSEHDSTNLHRGSRAPKSDRANSSFFSLAILESNKIRDRKSAGWTVDGSKAAPFLAVREIVPQTPPNLTYGIFEKMAFDLKHDAFAKDAKNCICHRKSHE